MSGSDSGERPEPTARPEKGEGPETSTRPAAGAPPGPSRVLSLARARKERMRAEQKALADANSVKFGRSKAERVLAATRADKARRALDQMRLEDE